MTIEKEERLKVLHSYFRGDWRAVPFKGSKGPEEKRSQGVQKAP